MSEGTVSAGAGKPSGWIFGLRLRPNLFRGFALILTWQILCWQVPLRAITIRDDVSDSVYTTNAAAPHLAAAGAFQNPFYWCNATLVHPEWAITANHCINAANPASFTFAMGANRNTPSLTRAVDAIPKNPAFNINVPEQGGDFGFLHLTQPVFVTPARIYRGTGELGTNASILGYGHTGNGITGENAALPLGIKRATENAVDVFGNSIGWSSKLILSDFDNPHNAADSAFGSATPTATEGNVALYDSGGAWFQRLGGTWYLTGITSFRANQDGADNSDYGDVSVAGRVSRDLTWIDANHDRSLFWTATSGNWNQVANWYGGIEPTSVNAAVIDTGSVSITNAGEVAEYVFVDGSGTLNLQNNLAASYLIVRGNGQLTFGNPVSQVNLTGKLRHEQGTLAFSIQSATAAGFDRLNVSDTALLDGTIRIDDAGYTGPANRGTTDLFTILSATSIDNQLDEVRYNGVLLGTNPVYTGTSGGGLDGMFREYDVSGGQLIVSNYLALGGDANGDRVVDGTDFGIWNANKFRTGTNWTTGDFNGDGNTDGSDFSIWNAAKFTSASRPAILVPEPGILTDILMSVLGLWILRGYPNQPRTQAYAKKQRSGNRRKTKA